jgi:hypothetical protein
MVNAGGSVAEAASVASRSRVLTGGASCGADEPDADEPEGASVPAVPACGVGCEAVAEEPAVAAAAVATELASPPAGGDG